MSDPTKCACCGKSDCALIGVNVCHECEPKIQTLASDLAEARREIERLKARNEELRSLLTDARTLIEKQTEWQKYGENLERDADATMAQELKDQRAKVVALKAEVERLNALVEAEQRGSFSSVVRQGRNELDTAIGERDAIRAENAPAHLPPVVGPDLKGETR